MSLDAQIIMKTLDLRTNIKTAVLGILPNDSETTGLLSKDRNSDNKKTTT